MILTHGDYQWLCKNQPLLIPGLDTAGGEGTLEIAAYFDGDSGRIFAGNHLNAQSHDTYIADRFYIRIDFEPGGLNTWPKIYEIGQRHRTIARRYGIPIDDLHFYPTTEACLGFEYPWDPPLTLEYFMTEIVEPFFYRLAYVDLYGLAAARVDLWPEHSHGKAGLIEHREDIRRGLRFRPASRTRNKRRIVTSL